MDWQICYRLCETFCWLGNTKLKPALHKGDISQVWHPCCSDTAAKNYFLIIFTLRLFLCDKYLHFIQKNCNKFKIISLKQKLLKIYITSLLNDPHGNSMMSNIGVKSLIKVLFHTDLWTRFSHHFFCLISILVILERSVKFV